MGLSELFKDEFSIIPYKGEQTYLRTKIPLPKVNSHRYIILTI